MSMFSDNNTIRRTIDAVFSGRLSDTDSCLDFFGPIYMYSMTPNLLKESKKCIMIWLKEGLS